jgi:CRISPR-associated endonuclease Csn1
MKTNSATLALDLGPNSIGWSLVDESACRIVAAGVRVFPEGVDRDQQGGEHSKNEQRRIARGMRRQINRRARRKRALRKALVTAGLLPDASLLPAEDPRRVNWEREQFMDSDPYALRQRALRERLEPAEIGRVLLHLNQRRGFLSNRKADRSKRKETSDMLKEISSLAADMGDRTLGEYLAGLHAAHPLERIRGRHTRRDMYEAEFEAIWSRQQTFHSTLLTEKLKYGTEGRQTYPLEPKPLGDHELLERFGLHGIIFFQRPMYWPKSVVGQCELEPKLKRCLRADRVAQRVRLLQEVNNLRLLDTSTGEERPLQPHERALLIEFLAKKDKRKFDEIRKEFCKKLDVPESIRFNLERGERTSLQGMPTDAALAHKDRFGKSWHERPEDEKNRIVRSLLEDEDAAILETATREWGLDAETAESVLETDFVEGYSSFSRVALEKLLPHLERGLPLMTRDGTPSALSEAGYLRPDQRVVNQKDFLPKPPELTNPLVRQALHEVRKVVNAIIREYGKPARIHIELAREIKGTAKDRERRSREMRDRERLRDEAAKRIREAGIKVTRDAIDRYLLWEEQKRECIYSGRPISFVQLFAGEIDADHILPRERSLDNSFTNRILCFRSENAAKKDRTPYEWLAESDATRYEAVLQRAVNLPYGKAKKFREKSVQLDDFFARQFVDTTYITTQVHEYVRCLGMDLVCTKGSHTHELRWQWGLDSVLRDDGLNLKNREDHRHHAVDAIVIALTDRSRLQQLAGIRRQGGTEKTGEVLTEPWPNFRSEVERVINAINVSHRAQRGIFGPLHKEMLYGATRKANTQNVSRPWAKGWVEEANAYVRRKSILELNNTKQLAKVRDKTLREILKAFLRKRDIDPDRPQKIPAVVWKELPTMPSGVPIKKVRLVERGEGFTEIRRGSFVELSSNHHYEIVELLDDTGKPVVDKKGTTKRKGYLVSMFEAANRVRTGRQEFKRLQQPVQLANLSRAELRNRLAPEMRRLSREYPVICTDHGSMERFIMSLSINEMVMLELDNGTKSLHRVQKMSEGSIILRPHTYAGEVSDTDKPPIIQRRGPNTLRGEKVVVDCLGRIRKAAD